MVTSPIIRKVKTDTLVIIEQVNAVVRVIIEQIYAVVLVIIEQVFAVVKISGCGLPKVVINTNLQESDKSFDKHNYN